VKYSTNGRVNENDDAIPLNNSDRSAPSILTVAILLILISNDDNRSNELDSDVCKSVILKSIAYRVMDGYVHTLSHVIIING
jgi:hypothetical protein